MKDCGIASIIAIYYQICCCVIPSLVTAIYSKLYRKSDRLLVKGRNGNNLECMNVRGWDYVISHKAKS